MSIESSLSTYFIIFLLYKVCVYDRAGLGLSHRPFEPVTNKSEEKPKPKVNRGVEFTVERFRLLLNY